MPRGRPATNPQPAPRSQPETNKKPTYEERRELAVRIEKTAAVLCEMLECLKKHGAREELLARAEQGFEFGILAALWSLDYINEQGNLITFE